MCPTMATAQPQQDQPLVSIVVTAYNDEQTVAQALQSALDQDWPHTEVLAVLDGPQDGTPARVAPFASAGVRVFHKPNGGTASARNLGLQHARGRWIQYLDGDDALLPDKISASLAALERAADPDEIALVYSGYYRMDEQGQIFAENRAEPYLRQKLLELPGHVCTNPLVRADRLRQIGGYSERYRYAEDTEMYHRLALQWRMLAVPQPHFLYRVSATQKTRVMRTHSQGNLVAEEPRRIRQSYVRAFAEQQPPWIFSPGQLSRRGVLDVGLRCPHSCKFCYYSFSDGSDDQFRAMRRASWRSDQQCRQILAGFAAGGLTHFDVTGGEPTLHPQIVELVRHARHELGLRARLITLGQFLTRRRKGRPTLLERLLEAGLDDLLLSVHAVDPQLFASATGGDYARLAEVMDQLDQRGFSYCTNTLVYQENYRHLPDIAEQLSTRRVRMVNLIVMNTYHEWNIQGRVLGVQARYRDIRPYLQHATALLEQRGIAVNIRYGPYCAYRGMEQNFVGVLGVELDPYEWSTTLRTGQIKPHASVQHYLQQQRAQLDDPDSMYTKAFGAGCNACRLRPICDGVDRKYIEQYGWSEFVPYAQAPGEQPVRDPLHYRVHNPDAFVIKCDGVRDQQQKRAAELQQRLEHQPDDVATYLALARQQLQLGDLCGLRQTSLDLEQVPGASTSAVLSLRARADHDLVARLPSAQPLLDQLCGGG